MKTPLSKMLMLVTAIVFLGISYVYCQEANMPVTTKSDQAKELYQKGMDAWDQVQLGEFMTYMKDACISDPDFFMAYFMQSMYNFYFKTRTHSKKQLQKLSMLTAN